MEKTEKCEAEAFLDKLLTNGAKEGIDHSIPLQYPPFYDENLYKKAQNYYFKYIFVIFSTHMAGLISVLSIPSIFTVLDCTKSSETNGKAYRRYLATIYHVVTWMLFPLKPGSPAWKSIDQVRKIHSRVSKSCEHAINARILQKDLVLTQFAFVGYFALIAEKYMTVEESEDFYKSWIHFWRVNAYLMGTKNEYNLCTDNWPETRERLIIVKEKVFKPALEKTGNDFLHLSKTLVNGLWYFSPNLTVDSILFTTKWLAGCDGYQYNDSDFKNGATWENTKLIYDELNWYQRFLVSSNFFVLNVLYKFIFVRWYFNFRILLTVAISYFVPFLAIIKFGVNHAYVRIFSMEMPKEIHTD